ncbi:carbohydrate sulfotransferase 15-like [Mya arenaria]|uniref:carbohydrate sulfotransferase 15-like n=1 Tax=Mya arenaria TaxID=6604 RepID=UPI0022E1F9CF|nr:carbohydrate sulfotransferase 15-like [Mya arenaria]
MKSETERVSKTTECITRVRRTFILTFALMFLTLTFLYGTTEHYDKSAYFQSLRPQQQIIRNDTKYVYNVLKSEKGSKLIRIFENSTKNTHSQLFNSSKVRPQSPKAVPNQTKFTKPVNLVQESNGNTILKPAIAQRNETPKKEDHQPKSEVKTQKEAPMKSNQQLTTGDLPLPYMRNQFDIRRFEPKLPAKLTGLTPLKPGIPESSEFPGMPDPCAAPRRNTGVEDILCMKPPEFLPEYKNPCWYDNGQFRCLPYFHLIGICKSGTSDLFKRLHLHPDIVPNRGIFGKEIWYWSWKRFWISEFSGKLKQGMTLRDFTNQFQTTIIQKGVGPKGNHNKITGHGDPMDIWDRFLESNTPQNSPGAEELLWTTPYAAKHINPNVKLLLMLRDPVDRLYSHYFHGGYGNSAQSFHEHVSASVPLWYECTSKHTIRHCIYDDNLFKHIPAPIYTSFYIVHLLEWLKVFPREQLFVFRNEDYTSDIRATISSICRFLDIAQPSEPTLKSMAGLGAFYATAKKQAAGPMLLESRKLLVDLYRPYTEELARFLGDERFGFRDKSFA